MSFQTITLSWGQAVFVLSAVIGGVAAWYDLRSKMMLLLNKAENHEERIRALEEARRAEAM